ERFKEWVELASKEEYRWTITLLTNRIQAFRDAEQYLSQVLSHLAERVKDGSLTVSALKEIVGQLWVPVAYGIPVGGRTVEDLLNEAEALVNPEVDADRPVSRLRSRILAYPLISHVDSIWERVRPAKPSDVSAVQQIIGLVLLAVQRRLKFAEEELERIAG